MTKKNCLAKVELFQTVYKPKFINTPTKQSIRTLVPYPSSEVLESTPFTGILQ
jgi:hypothetical protein